MMPASDPSGANAYEKPDAPAPDMRRDSVSVQTAARHSEGLAAAWASRTQFLTFMMTVFALCVFVVIESWGAFLPLTYDEPWYLDTVASIDQYGFVSRQFFRTFPGPTGPLHAWVHWILRPITHLAPPAVRLINPLLAAFSLLAVAASVRMTKGESPWGSALLMTAIPMAWPCVGLTLTEVPAMAFYAVHLVLLIKSWGDACGRGRCMIFSVLSGAAMGLAILGRQPLLLALAAVVACGLLDRRRFVSAAVCCATALAICVPVFMIWGGLTPRTMAGDIAARTRGHLAVFGIVPWHVAYAMAYAGITTAIVAPQCVTVRLRAWAAILAVCVGISILFGVQGQMPLQSVLGPVVPPTFRWMAEAACSGLALGLAICFGVALLHSLWQHRADTIIVLGLLTVLSQVVAAGAVRHQFSSRYLFAISPVVLIMASRFLPVPSSPIRAGIGAAVGALSLVSYFAIAAAQGE